jgi:predicted short-subunit dehydrogenase-like oxidoreductase (DUF2520 family)
MNQFRISITGAGRVGSAICKELYKNGFAIDLIVSESETSSRKLAESCNASWSVTPDFPGTSDLIIIAVPDHKIKNLLDTLNCSSSSIVAHTAGSVGLEVFPERIIRKGVFYPLQTFTVGRDVDFGNVPVLLESSDNASLITLETIAKSITSKVCYADAEHRKILHIAAVFVNNFTNHLLTRGKEVAFRGGYDFEILEPLIMETISKAIALGPENSQTGPAVRNDINTMEKQFDLLSFSPELQGVYKVLTGSIISYYKVKSKK